jgi:hypothetical protein
LIEFTPDLRLLLAPSSTYRQIADLAARETSRGRLIARVSIAPAVVGIVTGISATGRVSWAVASSGFLCWSFLAVAQTFTAVLLIGREGRALGYSRALELFFFGHTAWSLWLIAAAGYLYAASEQVRREDLLLMTAIVPAVWTAVVVFFYCREVLRLDFGRAIRRTVVHQSLTVLVIAAYVAWAVQLWPRLLAPTIR